MTDVLLVTTVIADDRELVAALRRTIGRPDANVVVVAPATGLSRLDWLTNDEDAARLEARRAAEATAAAVEARSVAIDGTSHDSDVGASVLDALRRFEPDEIVVVTRPGEQAGWLEESAVAAAVEASGARVRRVEVEPVD